MPEPADPKSIFQDAQELPAAERAAFLAGACRGDAALRARVEALLAAHDNAGAFLASPIAGAEGGSALNEQPGTVIGHYKLQQQIGEGGFGTVWMAEQQQPVRRQVALKIVKRGMDTRSVVARFEQERQALAMMDHPNIAKVLDGGETPAGRPYFAMELVRGVPITQFCDQQHLDARERLSLFVQVCHAVQHAHQKGIIHRDIKPSNVLVTLHDGVPVPKVIDFGVAKAVHRPLTEKTLFTEFQQMVGTPEYMSPEQAELSGLDIDTRADIYSLGVLLYELLTGTLPFDARTLAQKGLLEMLRVIREDEPPKPSTRISTLGESSTEVAKRRRTDTRRLGKLLRGDLDWIVMKALEKDRGRRYVSADALAADIQRHLLDEPVLASPPGRVYRLRKYVRRHRVGVTAGVVVVVALVGGLSAAVWGLLAANEQRDRAVEAEEGAVEQTRLATAAKEAAVTAAEKTAAALVRAEAGEAAAKMEAARANTVVSLVDDMLTSADPHENKGKDYRVRDLLEEFDRELGTRLQGEPEVDSAVRRLMGRAYRGLGLLDKAEPYLERALAIRRQRLGENHSEVAVSLIDQAMVRHDRGDYTGAMQLLEEAKRILVASSGPENLEVANVLQVQSDLQRHLGNHQSAEQLARDALAMARQLAGEESSIVSLAMGAVVNALNAQGRWKEAEDQCRLALAIDRRVFGDEHVDVAASLNNLATAIESQGRWGEAEQLHREALAMRRKLLGEEHQSVANSIGNLGGVMVHQGRLAEGEDLLRQALAMQRRLQGDEHPDVATMLNNLAIALEGQGKLGESEAVQREALDLSRRLQGDAHPDTLQVKGNLAALACAQGKVAEAADLLREVVEAKRRALGDDHPSTLASRNNLAKVWGRLGRHAEAAAAFRELLVALRRVEGEEHPHVATTLGNLAEELSAEGRLAEAEAVHREALGMLRKRLDDDHPDVINCLGELALVLQKQRRLPEAEELAREVLGLQRKRRGDEHPDVALSLAWLGRLLQEQDKLAEAEEASRLGLEIARRRLPAGDPEIGMMLAGLGLLQLRLGNHAGAEVTLRECLAMRREQQPGEWSTFNAMSMLGGALAGQGKHEEADPLLVEGYEKMQPPPASAVRKREALDRLVQHYEAWGKTEDAAKWRKVLDNEFPPSGK